MSNDYSELKEQICDVCHKMWQLGWVAANDGNVSVRLDDGTFLATPTGISKSFITTDKLVRIDGEGNVLEAKDGHRPSSEIKMHLRCYKVRSDVGSVLHAHPPTATGFAVAHIPLDRYCMIETVIAIGSVPVTPYGTPSTNEEPDAIEPYLVDDPSDITSDANGDGTVTRVPVIGVDSTPAGQQSIRENKMYATVLQDAVGQSTTAFELMYLTATQGTAIGATAGGITATTELGEEPASDPAVLAQCFLVPFKKVTKADL